MPNTTSDWEKKRRLIEFLKQILTYWEAEDKDDYMYIVHNYDLERVAEKIQALFTSRDTDLLQQIEGMKKEDHDFYESGICDGTTCFNEGCVGGPYNVALQEVADIIRNRK
jgi:hypothetical protein